MPTALIATRWTGYDLERDPVFRTERGASDVALRPASAYVVGATVGLEPVATAVGAGASRTTVVDGGAGSGPARSPPIRIAANRTSAGVCGVITCVPPSRSAPTPALPQRPTPCADRDVSPVGVEHSEARDDEVGALSRRRLRISAHTARHHTERVFAKLGLTSRRSVRAALLSRHDDAHGVRWA